MNTHIHFATILTSLIVFGALHSCAGKVPDRTGKAKLTAAESHPKQEEPAAPVITQQFFGCKAHR